MNIAFYAPLKSPNASTPSGDRQIARSFLGALEMAGTDVTIASELRTYEGNGDRPRQDDLKVEAQHEAVQYIDAVRAGRQQRPDFWFTYHVYHKAPDWIGPAVTTALGIPYVIAEASISPKQADGRWQCGHRAARDAVGTADLVIGLNPRDVACITPYIKPGATYEELAPFIDAGPFQDSATRRPELRTSFSRKTGIDSNQIWLLSVAMMRKGDKRASYDVLATSLEQLTDLPWHLFVVGDGPERENVMTRFAELSDRVTWLGEKSPHDLPDLYAAMDLFAWPAINEALGMVFLEAGASSIAVVAGHTDGVASIVIHEETGLIAPSGDAGTFAKHIRNLIMTPGKPKTLGEQAADMVGQRHSLEAASRKLRKMLQPLVDRALP